MLFGGESGEHEVSLASARSVIDALDREKYDVRLVGITKDGRWLAGGDPLALLEGKGDIDEDPGVSVVASGGHEMITGEEKGPISDVDLVFPVLHGTFGEDGTVQGLLELADLPYVGAGVLGSALGLDKAVQKAVLLAHGLPIVDYELILSKTWRADPSGTIALLEERFGYPLFVKPANAGSSVGVSKAHTRAELEDGLDEAAQYDRKILAEVAIEGREIECSVLGNDVPVASVPGEVVPCNEFYDYRAKYIDGDSELRIPAPLPEAVTRRIQELAIEAYKAIDCAGMARVDFFVCGEGKEIYLNELNTIPGFTSISMYPKLWEASGLSYSDLLDRLIDLALERYAEKKSLRRFYPIDEAE